MMNAYCFSTNKHDILSYFLPLKIAMPFFPENMNLFLFYKERVVQHTHVISLQLYSTVSEYTRGKGRSLK